MNKLIQKIVIVGGGTAGWLAANYLNHFLNQTEFGCQITLIESSIIGTIGVGEATIPTIRNTLSSLGFDETEWIVECNANFNIGAKFVNWQKGNDFFWFPFQPESAESSSLQMTAISHWLKGKLAGKKQPFYYLTNSTSCLLRANKSPKTEDTSDYQGLVNYGYLVDATLLAAYLKQKALAKGVNHISDHVTQVILNEHGFISHLITEKHGQLEGDLFIDCSGFQGLLINKALKEPFISFKDVLFCDKAVAILPKYNAPIRQLKPYITATAMKAGWRWHIPLLGRSGNGYVYASDFISPEAAELELRQQLGPLDPNIQARHVTMRTGHTRRTWVKNCVSLGLSSGFVEPLKSTGIFLVEAGLKHLIENFPDKMFSSVLQNKYNKLMTCYYEDFRDFIILHYHLSQRSDTEFWLANRYRTTLPDSVKRLLEQYSSILPNKDDALYFGLMGNILPYGYSFLFAGMNYLPSELVSILNYQDEYTSKQIFQIIKKESNNLYRVLHDNYYHLCYLHLKYAFQKSKR